MAHPLNVCMMYPNKHSYSETFVRDQIERLPEKVFPLYGAWFPFLQPGEKHILSRNILLRLYRLARRMLLNVPQEHLMREGLIRYLKKHKIDVALAHYALTGIAVMECCTAAQVPLVVHFHGFDAFEYKTLKENEAAYKQLFQLAQGVIAVSQHMKVQLCGLGCPPQKISVNPCGVDTEYFTGGGTLGSPSQFVAVGRFVPVKGPNLTIKAFHIVLQEIPDARLVMIGDGELLNDCKQLVHSLGISHAVYFPGPLAPEDVLKALRQSKVFVQHGIRNEQVSAEGMGLALMEASSTGLAVVATRHGGLKESVVHGETGFLVEEGDIVGMAEYMKKLALDDELCLRLGEQGRKRMINFFDIRKSIAVLDDVLRTAAQ